jgi:hypothetical protein
VNAERAGSFGFVPTNVAKGRENELLSEFLDGVCVTGAGLVHH